ncbi:MAG TPA: chromosome partitioning protein ParB, partial [Actinomycetota bacterium]|nr:chromosome partitioning protein ParB [Actinomycetota bacterium]
EGGMTQESLASRIGKNRVTVTTTLRLLELPISIQRYLIDGRIAAGHGRALLGLRDSPFVEKLARRVAEEGMSVRETERLVKRYQAMDVSSRGPAAGSNPRPPEITEAQRRLAEHLQTRVRVDMGKRKGKIELDFVSLEELHRLLEAILGDARAAGPRVVSPD